MKLFYLYNFLKIYSELKTKKKNKLLQIFTNFKNKTKRILII